MRPRRTSAPPLRRRCGGAASPWPRASGSPGPARRAAQGGRFKDELAPFTLQGRRGDTVVDTDEGVTNMNVDKLPKLRPAFKKDGACGGRQGGEGIGVRTSWPRSSLDWCLPGTVTAANASPLNDGAAAMVIMSAEKAKEMGVTPLARIRGASIAVAVAIAPQAA